MITITIDNRLRLPLAALPSRLVTSIEREFTHKNPAYGKAKAQGRIYTKEPPKIATHRREVDEHGHWHLTLPRGGMGRVCDALDTAGIAYDFLDNRSHGDDLGNYTGDYVTPQVFPSYLQTPWDHQARIKAGILDCQNCIIRSPTGSGKTSAILLSIQRANKPAIVVMNDTKLLKQWQKRVAAELGIPVKEQGIIHGKKRRLRPITLAMQQTLRNLSDEEWSTIAHAFGFMGLDEVQTAAAVTVQDVVDRFSAYYRVGVSADETRADRKEFLNYDIFGDVAVTVTKQELIDAGVIHRVSVRIVPTEYEDPIYEAQPQPDWNGLLDRMTANANRNDLIRRLVEGCMRELQPTLVFSHRTEHCSRLDAAFAGDGHATGLMLGGKPREAEFAETLAGIMSGDINIGVGTYKAIGTGQDVPPIEAGICTTPIHNNRQFVDQLSGRMCRISPSTGKTAARLYYLWDHKLYGRRAVQQLVRWCDDVKILSDNEWVDAREYLKVTYGKKKKS